MCAAAQWACVCAAVAIPTMALVPIVTLLFGYFPIALNFWTVVAITVYYVALHALTFYCRSMREFRALWLANVGTSIMFWPYFKAALFTPIKQLGGKGLTFKATSKGGAKQAVTLKEIGPSLLLVFLSLVSLLFGLVGVGGRGSFDINVNAPKAIALLWVLYNMVPHVLLLTYARFGKGGMLRFMCSFLMYLQSVVSILALVLLWLLYPREEDYSRAADLSLDFLYAQRSGQLGKPYPVPWRQTSGIKNTYQLPFPVYDGTGTLSAFGSKPADLTGGFYTDGEIGPVKVTTHVALTTSMLAWSLLDYAEWWAKDQGRLDSALELVQHGMKYVDACYIVGDAPANPLTGSKATDDDLLIYQVRASATTCCVCCTVAGTRRVTWRTVADVRRASRAVPFASPAACAV
jgi:Glycosyl hydrolase family 9